MPWNKLHADVPAFIWESDSLLKAEWTFMAEAAANVGMAKLLGASQQADLAVDSLAADIVASMEIENEIVDASLVAAGIRSQLGLTLAGVECQPIADGCASLILDVSRHHSRSISENWLDGWREFFWRHFSLDRPTPPSLTPDRRRELRDFITWLNTVPPRGDTALARAGLAHLWLESIHPLPLGSGIVGRIIAEMILARSVPGNSFTPLCTVLLRRRIEYHRQVDTACRDRDATQWLLWFAAAVIEAGRLSRARLELAINRERLLESLREEISGRQERVLLDIFSLGDAAFLPGVCPAHYAAATGRDVKSVAADMANLTAAGALRRTIRGRTTRYHLALPSPEVARVAIDDIL
ncbi:MAG: DUF4172 domain-containing protein [Planctomycetaceae bacterium]|nr:DUF4172 domain-containing protein [Planctomycetaceae bacterium]